MRRASKVDANQQEIVRALRRCGIEVAHTHVVGNGFPDLVAAHRERHFLLEVKMPGESLNKMEREFHASWPAKIHIVHSADEALRAVIGDWK